MWEEGASAGGDVLVFVGVVEGTLDCEMCGDGIALMNCLEEWIVGA